MPQTGEALVIIGHPSGTTCRNDGQTWSISYEPHADVFCCTWCRRQFWTTHNPQPSPKS